MISLYRIFKEAMYGHCGRRQSLSESILLGLPIPSVFLYREEETQKLLIIDGFQRLSTLYAYYKGKFPQSNQVFRLKDVKSRYQNRSLTELQEEDHRRLEDAVIHAMIIQQTAPSNDNSSVYYTFDRWRKMIKLECHQ